MVNIIIPIGGIGKRFSDEGFKKPKPLINVLGKPILFWLLDKLSFKDGDVLYIPYNSVLQDYNFEDQVKHKMRDKNISIVFKKIDKITKGAAETILLMLKDIPKKKLNEPIISLDSDNFYEFDILNDFRNDPKNIIYYFKDFQQNPVYSYIKIDDNSGLVNKIEEKNKISDNACVGAYGFLSIEDLIEYINSIISKNLKSKNEFYISNIYGAMINNDESVYSKEIKKFFCLGTPNLIKLFSQNYNNEEKLRFCFDLDNTLVTLPEKGDYNKIKPITKNINLLKFLYDRGHIIIIYTARRMKTHKGNVGAILSELGELTLKQLREFNIPFHEIYFGKPYANYYIDDLSVNPFYDCEKEIGFFRK